MIADYAGDPLEQRHIAGKVFLPLPMDAAAAKRLQVLVRASGDPSLLVQTVRRQIRDAAVGNTVAGAFTYAQITETMGEELLVGTVPLVPLIAIGMLLTTAGIYGVLAFAITRRSRELAVRVRESEDVDQTVALADAFQKVSRVVRLTLALDFKLERDAARDARDARHRSCQLSVHTVCAPRHWEVREIPS